MLVEILIFLVVFLGIVYIIINYMNAKPTYQGPSALYDLSKANQIVLNNSDLPWNGKPCSLRFAIYISKAPRTLTKVNCITINPSTDTVAFGPSCDDYSFSTCKCASIDCSRCSTENKSGYMSQLLSIGNSLQLWTSGYTSENDKPYVPALLKVKTGTDLNQYYMESISLPAIPLQRWTVITIVKEGRRFDVYYGAVSVASKICDHVPIPPSTDTAWRAGNSGWRGQIGLFAGIQKTQTTEDVEKDVTTLVDSRGVPFYLNSIDLFSIAMPTLPECIFGNCNTLPAVKPMNPFTVYSSSVS
jgi:hypothetical protein